MGCHRRPDPRGVPGGGVGGAVIRIGIVTTGYPPDVGGVETVVGGLAPALARNGQDVCVLAAGSRCSSTMAESSLRVERFPNWLHSSRYSIAPGLWWRAKKIDAHVDVINAHSFHAVAAMGVAAATRAPFVFTPHYHGVGHTPVARLAHIPYDRMARLLFDRSKAVICVSSAEAALLGRDYPSTAAKIEIIPNGVDVDAIMAARPFSLDRRVILVAGRLERYKNIDRMVSALPHLPADTLLVVIGQGPEQARLRALAVEAALGDRVQFAGTVDVATLRRWQRTAAVTISLSRHEAFGLVMLEAVVAGGKAVVSDISAHRETAQLIDGRGVYFVRDGPRPQELAQVVLDAMHAPRTTMDAAQCATLSWGVAAQKLLGVLQGAAR